MIKKILSFPLLLLLILAAPFQLFAQSDTPPAPKYEFRSVWVPTVAAAQDWPTFTYPATEEGIRNLIRNLKNRGQNAVVLQVVGRGDALYPSVRLPWVRQITGTYGGDPGWDPLAVAIDEAHRLGMEFHAWYNVFRIGDSTLIEELDEGPNHVLYENPEWVRSDPGAANQLWLDAGIPDARAWAVGNVLEIVRNYDIDAIHFDFIRYPTNGFASDFDTKALYNPKNIIPTAEWRRDNVTEFNRAVYDSVMQIRPRVKVGSTPVGHYKFSDGWAFLSGYSSVYQDSRGWLNEGVNDYIVPQIYWDIGDVSAPRFDWLVRDWMGETYGRHVYIGTGPYQPHIRAELPVQIDTTRVNGAAGQVHFRFASVGAGRPFDDRYDLPAIIPPMPWKDMTAPGSPVNLIATWPGAGGTELTLTWEAPDFGRGDAEPARYAVYRIPVSDNEITSEHLDNPANLIMVTGETFFVDTPDMTVPEYDYFVTALSHNNVESEPAGAGVNTSADDERYLARNFSLDQNYPNPFNPSTTIRFALDDAGYARIRIFDQLGRLVAEPLSDNRSAGTHTVSFNASHLASGVYIYRLEFGNRQLTRKMMLVK
ncbi:MAG: family 10 glycosylhydrolase [Cyclonatronaceae bacterium]